MCSRNSNKLHFPIWFSLKVYDTRKFYLTMSYVKVVTGKCFDCVMAQVPNVKDTIVTGYPEELKIIL